MAYFLVAGGIGVLVGAVDASGVVGFAMLTIGCALLIWAVGLLDSVSPRRLGLVLRTVISLLAVYVAVGILLTVGLFVQMPELTSRFDMSGLATTFRVALAIALLVEVALLVLAVLALRGRRQACLGIAGVIVAFSVLIWIPDAGASWPVKVLTPLLGIAVAVLTLRARVRYPDDAGAMQDDIAVGLTSASS
ncbi:MAG: hypothetical protein U1E29_05800 [Coriobacteriia bacterium]|nr:hypothetical protein [Coriobacteriia bacterium]